MCLHQQGVGRLLVLLSRKQCMEKRGPSSSPHWVSAGYWESFHLLWMEGLQEARRCGVQAERSSCTDPGLQVLCQKAPVKKNSNRCFLLFLLFPCWCMETPSNTRGLSHLQTELKQECMYVKWKEEMETEILLLLCNPCFIEIYTFLTEGFNICIFEFSCFKIVLPRNNHL